MCAKDLLELSEFDVLGLSCMDDGVNYEDVETFFRLVVDAVTPPLISAYDMDDGSGSVSAICCARSGVGALDSALRGGFRAGHVTELVGQSGAGKTQFCMTASILAAASGRRVVYIDTENKFRPQRLMEIVQARKIDLPSHADLEYIGQNIFVLSATTSEELETAIAEAKAQLLDHTNPIQAGLLIVDSMASLSESVRPTKRTRSEKQQRIAKHEMIARQGAALKLIANAAKVPVLVTNQVKSAYKNPNRRGWEIRGSIAETGGRQETTSVSPALGNTWAHSVNVRIFLENYGTSRGVRVAKSSSSEVRCMPFEIANCGVRDVVQTSKDTNDDDIDDFLSAMPDDQLERFMKGEK